MVSQKPSRIPMPMQVFIRGATKLIMILMKNGATHNEFRMYGLAPQHLATAILAFLC